VKGDSKDAVALATVARQVLAFACMQLNTEIEQ
jgi:hypothetical protein